MNVVTEDNYKEDVDDHVNGEAHGLGSKKFLLDVFDGSSVETSTPLVENNALKVFTADKSTSSKTAEDIPEDELSMLSLMTFGEKQVYFAQQIQAQEAAAQNAAQRSPLPRAKEGREL